MKKKKTYLQPDCKVIEMENDYIIATSAGSTEAYLEGDTDDWF